LVRQVITESPDEKYQPQVTIKNEKGKIVKSYLLPSKAHLWVENNEEVYPGSILAKIPREIDLLSENIIKNIATMKKDILGSKSESLNVEEALIALSISAATNPAAQLALEKLTELRSCEAHMTHIPTPGDEAGLRRLGVNLTSEPNFSTKNLFMP
jgi:uncharacterized protein (UPF0371 family)